MAKQNGLGMAVTVDDGSAAPQTISNDVTNLDFSTPGAVIDVTGVDKSAFEKIIGLRDWSVTLNGPFNVASNHSHDVFKTVPAGLARTVVLALGGKSLTNETLFTDYKFTRDTAGTFNWQAPGVLSDGTVPAWA